MTGKRIRELRTKLHLTQSEFVRRTKITQTYLSQVETGKANISPHLVAAIAAEFGASRKWLETGKEPMFRADGEGLDRLPPDARACIKRLTEHFVEKVPSSEAEETVEMARFLVDILTSDNEDAKTAIRSSLKAFRGMIESGERKKRKP